MAVVTISRTPWIDDDGSGTYGTVINNAEKTALYNQIDAALAQLLPLSGGTVTGVTSFSSNVTVNGQLQVASSYAMRNTVSTGRTDWYMGNDSSATLLDVVTYGSAYTSTGGFDQPNGTLWYHAGSGGMTFLTATAAPIRFYTNSFERVRITGQGEILINATTPAQACRVLISSDNTVNNSIVLVNTNAGAGGYFQLFCNYNFGVSGSISHPNLSSVAYNTTSDRRLKTDRGGATDLAALRGVVVHDFAWTADGTPDRGVFAQEAIAVFPRAITKGGDEVDEAGTLTRPWMTDYSKFVADLIVGFQQHDAAIAALRDELSTLKGS